MRPLTLKWFSKVLATFLLLIPVHTAQADTGDLGLYEKLKAATASQPNNLIRFDPVKPGDSTRPELKKADPKTRLKIEKSFSAMPLMFEENKGQTSGEVRFYSRGRGYNFYLTPTESVMVLSKTVREHPGPVKEPHRFDHRENMAPPKTEQSVVRMEVVGANEKAAIRGEEKLQSTSHYFVGNDKSKWRQGVAHYQKVHYEEVYKGIDLVYYGNQSKLEYDFIVKPGADPNAIRLQYNDIDHMSMEGGDLVIEKGFERIIQKAPKIYQVIDGKQITIEGNYIFTDTYEVGFYLGEYDTSQPLVIDPVLLFSTYLGGSDSDYILSAKTDSSGLLYITGYTRSLDFPAENPLDGGNVNSGAADTFVAKIDPAKSTIWFSTYLGGIEDDLAYGLALDDSGYIYVTGRTNSADFPILNPFPGGETHTAFYDGFVFKLNPSGDEVLFSTFLGGSGNDTSFAIDLDTLGNVYITGETSSIDFPVLNPLPAGDSFSGKTDAFISKLNSSGNTLIYSSYLGGGRWDKSKGIAVDASGNAYIAGETDSDDFPIFNPLPGGGAQSSAFDIEAFVCKIAPGGDSFVYSTYLGDEGWDSAYAIKVDDTGSAYVTGFTRGDFPIVNAFPGGILERGEDGDIFVSKISPNGDALDFSIAFGGADFESGNAIELDDGGNIYLVGNTWSHDFPFVNPIAEVNPIPINGRVGFALKLTAMGRDMVFSTDFEGSPALFTDIAIDPSGKINIVGHTPNAFPLVNPIPNSRGSNSDGVIATIQSTGTDLFVSPSESFQLSGTEDGPFNPEQKVYLLSNTTNSPIEYSVTKTQDWIDLTNASGTLAPGEWVEVTVTLNSVANGLFFGNYSDTLTISNITTGIGNTTRDIELTILGHMVALPEVDINFTGSEGGPFFIIYYPYYISGYLVQNNGSAPFNYSVTSSEPWVDLSNSSGTLAPGTNVFVSPEINILGNDLLPGTYSSTLTFANETTGSGNTTRNLQLTVQALPPAEMEVTPSDDFLSSGNRGGPFNPTYRYYRVENIGVKSMDYSVSTSQPWIRVDNDQTGTLNEGEYRVIRITIYPKDLPTGFFSEEIIFTNETNGLGNTVRAVEVTVNPVIGHIKLSDKTDFLNVGPESGVFDPNQKTYTLENPGDFPVDYSVTKTVDWLTIENSSGNIPAFSSVDITVSLENSVNSFPSGVYSDTLTFTNLTNGTGDTTRNAGISIAPLHFRLTPPKMVKDIYPGSSSGLHYLAPRVAGNKPFPVIDGNVFFIASDGINGQELWKSDGTEEGTVMVKDINSVYRYLTKALNTLFFVANDGTHDEELWKSDGTEEGTFMVKDINPNGNAYINHLMEFNGSLYFTAYNGTSRGLFKSDGTESGTTMVVDFGAFGFVAINYPTPTKNFIYFFASDGTHGAEPWKTDGTEEGTVLLKDINPGAGTSLSYVQNPPDQWFCEMDGILYFAADDGIHGSELWKSDGTEEGTVLLKDINPGSPTGFLPNKTGQNVIGSYFFFSGNDGIHGFEPWKSDGTEAGTVFIKDLLNGSGGSDLQLVTEYKGNAYFVANPRYISYDFWEIFKSDGTEAGTHVLKETPFGINGPAPSNLVVIDNLLFFGWADPIFHGELWVTDGSEEFTMPVTHLLDTANAHAVHAITKLNRKIVFIGFDYHFGGELHSIDLPEKERNDINGDGTSDLLAMETLFGTVAAGSIENATVTNIQGLVQAAPNLGWAVSSTGDFNGDTNADLLLYNTTTGEIRLVLLDGFTILSDTVVHTLNTAEGFVPFTTGNFNASTIDEIVLYNATSGAVDLLYLQAGAFYKREPVSGVPDIASGWQLIGSGLFDAGRKFDLLWHNTLTTEIAYSEIDGSTQVSLVNFGPAPSPDWVPVGTADYNNDGKDDVLLWDTVNRTLGAWLQDSGTVLSLLVFGTLPTTLDYLNSGDYNGDGLADLLIWDPATGAVLAVLQDGTAITSVPFLLFLDTAAGWTVIPGKL